MLLSSIFQNEVKTENQKPVVMLQDPVGGLFVGGRSAC